MLDVAGTIFGGVGQPIRIYVHGPEVTRLKLAAEQVHPKSRLIRSGADVAAAASPASVPVGGGVANHRRCRK